MNSFIEEILRYKETFFTLVITIMVFYAVRWVLNKSSKEKRDWGVIRSSILFAILLIGAIAIILALPMSDNTKGNIAGLIGIVLSAIFALSSATFMGNGLAGVMLRTINNFREGDFIRSNEYLGRITERGLFHTEIQTENRDLVTIPNLYLATHPVRVTHSKGTFISATCSLGYEVNRVKIEKALLQAAENAELKEGFVRITKLGDYSVVYKVFGMLKEVKTIISAESRLNARVLDALHDAGIEIVSPAFMNQKQVGEQVFIPKKVKKKEQQKVDKVKAPDNLIFDKADEAESLENRKRRLDDINKKIQEIKEELNIADQPQELEKRLKRWNDLKEQLLKQIEEQSNELK